MKLFEGTLFECQMIVNLLKNEGIESYLNNEIIGTRGGNIYSSTGGVTIIVADSNYNKAKEIVSAFEKSRKD
ncbi:MAG: DUF2007 domain-containing protein [Bacteroidales bacterium]|nr:DUF2007 domain-containing protein [Bacteroidales bacterium]